MYRCTVPIYDSPAHLESGLVVFRQVKISSAELLFQAHGAELLPVGCSRLRLYLALLCFAVAWGFVLSREISAHIGHCTILQGSVCVP